MNETSAATIDSTQLRHLLDSGTPLHLLDVRTPGEFETVHISGAHNVPLDLLRRHRDEIVEHLGDHVVLVCRSSQRAALAAEDLRKAGLVNTSILEGGVTAWDGKGFAVTRGAQRWDIERQVRLVAGSIVLASVLSSIIAPSLKWLAAAIGGGLTIAALTNSCAMGMLLSRMPYNRGRRCDVNTVVADLAKTSASCQTAGSPR